jgi:integral membrane protein
LLFQENDTLKEKFRKVAKIEGYSFLILLFIAMPLKYVAGLAIATKIIGMIHGALWVWYLYLQYQASKEEKWRAGFNIFAFLMSLIPFGTFWLSSMLKQKD